MGKLAIPHNAYVFVGDGRKALFLRNDGDEKFPNLKAERIFVDENPRTQEQGSDVLDATSDAGTQIAAAAFRQRTGMSLRSAGSHTKWPAPLNSSSGLKASPA